MTSDILWEPEVGTCGECKQSRRLIRQYSSEGTVRRFCFECWDREQEPRVMSSTDWQEEDRVVFVYPPEEPPSKAA